MAATEIHLCGWASVAMGAYADRVNRPGWWYKSRHELAVNAQSRGSIPATRTQRWERRLCICAGGGRAARSDNTADGARTWKDRYNCILRYYCSDKLKNDTWTLRGNSWEVLGQGKWGPRDGTKSQGIRIHARRTNPLHQENGTHMLHHIRRLANTSPCTNIKTT